MIKRILLLLLVITTYTLASVQAQQLSNSRNDTLETYDQLLEILFPRDATLPHDSVNSRQYTVTLRFRPSFYPESQLIIARFYDGKVEAVFYTTANGKNIWNQMHEIGEASGRSDLDYFAKSISIKRQVIQKPSKELKRLLERFPGIRFSLPPDTDKVIIIDDGFDYDLWVDAGYDKSFFTTNDRFPPGPYKFPVVKWMNDVLKAIDYREYEK